MHFYTLQGLSNLICRYNAVDGHYLNLVLVTFRAFCFCMINIYSQVLNIVWKNQCVPVHCTYKCNRRFSPKILYYSATGFVLQNFYANVHTYACTIILVCSNLLRFVWCFKFMYIEYRHALFTKSLNTEWFLGIKADPILHNLTINNIEVFHIFPNMLKISL